MIQNPIARKMIDRINDLPTLPTVIMTLYERLSRDSTSSSEIAKVIEKDQSLASQVLRLSNSAYFGFKNKICDIQQAISLLGFTTIANLVLASSVIKKMQGGIESPLFSPDKFWKHSIATAAAGKFLSLNDKSLNMGEVFSTALLHDIGKIVLHRWFAEPFQEVLNYHIKREMPLYDAEIEINGFTHCDIGYVLGLRWHFPPPLLMSMLYHHRPGNTPEKNRLVALIHVADSVTQAIGLGSSGNAFIPSIDRDAWNQLGLKAGLLDQAIPNIIQETEQNLALLGIIISDAEPPPE